MKTQQNTNLDKILVLLWVSLKVQIIEQVVICSVQELIEDVKVPLAVVLVHNAGFLQQVVQDVTAHWCPLEEVPQKTIKAFELISYITCDKVKKKLKVPTLKSNWISMYFPKRLELSFLRVLALPNACTKQTVMK